MQSHLVKVLTYESARNLKDLELLENMEVLDNLNDEISFLQNQLKVLKQECSSIQKTNYKKKKQKEYIDQQFNVAVADDFESESEYYRSFSKREGFQDHLKLGDLVVFGKEENSEEDVQIDQNYRNFNKFDEDDGPTIAKKFCSQANSRREIQKFSRSLDMRKDLNFMRQSRIFKKMQIGKTQNEIRWETLGFKAKKEISFRLTDSVRT